MTINSDWLNVALEEYKSLRTESLTAMGNQQATLRFGIAVLGVILGLAVTAKDDFHFRFYLLSLLCPIFTLLVFALYAIEFGRMVRVGRYIEYIEIEINSMVTDKTPLNKPPLKWETWLNTLQEIPRTSPPLKQKGNGPRIPFYFAIPATFLIVTIFSTFMACLSPGPFDPARNIIMSVSVAG
jgi:hypothetical protein